MHHSSIFGRLVDARSASIPHTLDMSSSTPKSETPVAGVDQAEFERAVHDLKELCDAIDQVGATAMFGQYHGS